MLLENYIAQLDHIFSGKDRYQSHKEAAPVLLAMAKNPAVLHEIVSNNLNDDKILGLKKQGPVLNFDIINKRNYTFSAHCFMPLPDRAVDVSHNWIHHHDHSLLTSVNAFGNIGYNSLLFNKDYSLHASTQKVTNLKIVKDFYHPLYNVEFVDSFVPHVVFLPPTLTITFALWSFDYLPKNEGIRSNPILQALKGPIKGIINFFGASQALQIETETQNRQFAAINGEIVCVGNKLYPYSSSEDYMQNIFYVLQEIGYRHEPTLESLKIRAENDRRKDIAIWIDKLLHGEKIEDHVDPIFMNVPGINFTKDAIVEACKNSSL
jgi:hypothetical protein